MGLQQAQDAVPEHEVLGIRMHFFGDLRSAHVPRNHDLDGHVRYFLVFGVCESALAAAVLLALGVLLLLRTLTPKRPGHLSGGSCVLSFLYSSLCGGG